MTKIKFKNKEFRVDSVEFAMCDNKPIDIIIHANFNTLKSIVEFARGPYIIQEFDGVSSALHSRFWNLF